jgi:hypothetical protein
VGRGELLLVTGASGGESRAHVSELRNRFSYALASGVEVSLRVHAQSLRAGDAFSVGFDLSRHPGERRSLVYRFRWEGSEADATGPAGGEVPWTVSVPRTLPTGGRITVRLPLSRDVETSWPIGLDSNLLQVWFELSR